MNITVTSEKPESGKLIAKLVVDAADVDKAIKDTYKTIASQYNFQGFRRGRTPRPVIDGIVGKEAILADATNTLLSQAEPLMLDELDVIPLLEPNYGDEPATVVEGKPYEAEVEITVAPDVELASYDAPAINMPPAEPTEAEIDQQIEQLMGYHVTYEDMKTKRAVKKSDIISVTVENIEGGEAFAGEDRMLAMDNEGLPEEFDKAIIGMKPGETKEIEWVESHEHGDHTHEHKIHVKLTVNSIKKEVRPELDDEFAKTRFGFDTVEKLREALVDEIRTDKSFALPSLKENRVVEAMAENLKLDEVPEEYTNSVFTELVQNFLTNLQRQGQTLDSYLQMAGITAEAFLDDTRVQAEERARQSLALDALAAHMKAEVSQDDLVKEFTEAGMEDAEASIEEFRTQGRLPAVRAAIRRNKALEWLVENAKVTEVDEVAEAAEKKAAKKSTKKSTKKDEKKDEAAE